MGKLTEALAMLPSNSRSTLHNDLCFFLTGFTQGEETTAKNSSFGELQLTLTNGATGSKSVNCAPIKDMPKTGDATPLTLSLVWKPIDVPQLGSYQGQIVAKAVAQGGSTDNSKQYLVQAVRIVIEAAAPSAPTPPPGADAPQKTALENLADVVLAIIEARPQSS